MKSKAIPTSVFVFGLVSFLTDVSSDMIYPLLPLFLVQYLGAGQGFIGLVEGFAESTAAFFTLLSGLWADRARDRSKLVLFGYSLSSFSRPLVALAWNPWVVFLIRFSDRMGKGIRTAPRDALIADSVPRENRGRAFGLQRSMDHAGAVLGPLLASLLLATVIKNLRHLFLLAAIPGIMAVILVAWKVREMKSRPQSAASSAGISLGPPSGKLRIYFAILFLFILSCSSDAFLLLRVGELGVRPALIPVIWMLFNLVKAATTMPLGALSDSWGRRRVLLIGWFIYAGIYAAFALAHSVAHAWLLFGLYGLFYGFTEGTERAFLADYADPHERGRAFGWHYFIVGWGALPASLLFGLIYERFGSKAAFLTSACISLSAAALLFCFMRCFPSAPKVRSSGPVPA